MTGVTNPTPSYLEASVKPLFSRETKTLQWSLGQSCHVKVLPKSHSTSTCTSHSGLIPLCQVEEQSTGLTTSVISQVEQHHWFIVHPWLVPSPISIPWGLFTSANMWGMSHALTSLDIPVVTEGRHFIAKVLLSPVIAVWVSWDAKQVFAMRIQNMEPDNAKVCTCSYWQSLVPVLVHYQNSLFWEGQLLVPVSCV